MIATCLRAGSNICAMSLTSYVSPVLSSCCFFFFFFFSPVFLPGGDLLQDCNMARAFTVFRTLGLRHMLAVDNNHQLVGIITRKDLTHHRVEAAIAATHTGSTASSDSAFGYLFGE